MGSREGTQNDWRGQGEAGWSQMSNPQLAPQEELQAGLSSSRGDGGKHFWVSPDRAVSPAQAEQGCAEAQEEPGFIPGPVTCCRSRL